MRVVFVSCVWVSAIRSRSGASFALLSEISLQRFGFGVSVPLFLEFRSRLWPNLNDENDNKVFECAAI